MTEKLSDAFMDEAFEKHINADKFKGLDWAAYYRELAAADALFDAGVALKQEGK